MALVVCEGGDHHVFARRGADAGRRRRHGHRQRHGDRHPGNGDSVNVRQARSADRRTAAVHGRHPRGTHQPCVTSPSTAGMSTTLFIGGKPALLATATGPNSKRRGPRQVDRQSAGQTQLQAT